VQLDSEQEPFAQQRGSYDVHWHECTRRKAWAYRGAIPARVAEETLALPISNEAAAEPQAPQLHTSVA
jgi:hypothetical protein